MIRLRFKLSSPAIHNPVLHNTFDLTISIFTQLYLRILHHYKTVLSIESKAFWRRTQNTLDPLLVCFFQHPFQQKSTDTLSLVFWRHNESVEFWGLVTLLSPKRKGDSKPEQSKKTKEDVL